MKLSVVIPAYNEEKYIHIPLRSLGKQVEKYFEVVVCLNKCTDNTEHVVRTIAKEENLNIKVIEEKNKGVAYARDAGFKNSSGQIIASADADTYYPPEWTGLILKNFANKSWDCIYGPVHLMSNSKLLEFSSKFFFTFFLQASHLFGNYNLNGMNFSIRREIFNIIGGFNIGWKSAEDVYVGIKLREMNCSVGFIKDLKVFTNDRRFVDNKFATLKHHIKNYVRIFIKKIEPANFKDIR